VARVNIYGEDIKKYEPNATPKSDIAYELLVPLRRGTTGNNYDRMILNWNNKNPADQWYPDEPAPNFSHREKKYTMTSPEYEEFARRSGREFVKMLGGREFNYMNPTPRDIETFKGLMQGAREKVRAEMVREGAFSALKAEKKFRRTEDGRLEYGNFDSLDEGYPDPSSARAGVPLRNRPEPGGPQDVRSMQLFNAGKDPLSKINPELSQVFDKLQEKHNLFWDRTYEAMDEVQRQRIAGMFEAVSFTTGERNRISVDEAYTPTVLEHEVLHAAHLLLPKDERDKFEQSLSRAYGHLRQNPGGLPAKWEYAFSDQDEFFAELADPEFRQFVMDNERDIAHPGKGGYWDVPPSKLYKRLVDFYNAPTGSAESRMENDS
jgi:hypothetical protein